MALMTTPPDDSARSRIERLCHGCLPRAGADGSGVALATRAGMRDVVYATDAVALAVERVQTEVGEGPGIDAASSLLPVAHELFARTDDAGDDRWPFFRAETSGLGLRALYAFPILAGAVALGTLGLYRVRAGIMSPAQVMAALATVAELAPDLAHLVGGVDWQVDAPSSRVHQATGMIMVQLDSDIDDALARLRSTAFARGTTLREMADLVIDGRYRFDEDPV